MRRINNLPVKKRVNNLLVKNETKLLPTPKPNTTVLIIYSVWKYYSMTFFILKRNSLFSNLGTGHFFFSRWDYIYCIVCYYRKRHSICLPSVQYKKIRKKTRMQIKQKITILHKLYIINNNYLVWCFFRIKTTFPWYDMYDWF